MKNYVRKTEVKDTTDYNIGADYIEKLNEIVHKEVKRSEERAEANGRKTLSARDL